MNIFGSIGHFLSNLFGGGDDDNDKKRKRQQNNAPVYMSRGASSGAFSAGNNNQQQQQQPKPKELNLVQSRDDEPKPKPKPKPKQAAPVDRFSLDPLTLRRGTPQFSTRQESSDYSNKIQNNPILKPFFGVAKAALNTPRAAVRLAQNKPIDDIKKDTFGTVDDKKIAKKIIGDTAGVGLTLLGPKTEAEAVKAGEKLIGPAASTLTRKVVPKVAKTVGDTLTGAGFGGSVGLSEDHSGKEILTKDIPIGAAAGGLTRSALEAAPLLRNLSRTRPQVSKEVEPGIKSVNPKQAEDAEQVAAARAKAEADKLAQAEAQAVEAQAPKSSTVTPAVQEANPASIQATPTGAPPTAPPEVVLPKGETQAPVVPSGQAQAPSIAPTPATEAPQAVPVELPAAPARTSSVGNKQVAVAPRTHDALVKKLGGSAKALKGQYGKREPVNIDDLKIRATGELANLSDDDIVRAYSSVPTDEIASNPEKLALARATLDRISRQPDNPEANTVTQNILSALEEATSKAGFTQRFLQEDFDNIPLPMKVRYIVKKIDKANSEVEGYVPLADDPAQAKVVEQTLNNFLATSEGISSKVAALQGQLQNIASEAEKGNRLNVNVSKLIGELRNDQRALEVNNGELAKYYQSLLPARSRGQRINDFARNMMLGSFTGRVNDIITTGGNVANLGAENTVRGVLAKGANLVRPGVATDTLRGGRSFVRGTREGLRRGIGEFRGKQYSGDLRRSLQNDVNDRTDMRKANTKLGRTIQAATNFATELTRGVREQNLYQQAAKEAQQLKVPRELVDTYAQARAATPSRAMLDKADQLQREVNNLNDNPVTKALRGVANSIGTDKPGLAGTIGGVIKNQIAPFPTWLGGNIYNSITDKNVVASAVKVVNSAVKGDIDSLIQNISKTASNATQAYALGYLLTKAGIITNEDAEGYNDAGAYLHIGDRYIPAGLLGFFAPNLVLGNAAYHGLNDSGNDNIGEKIGSTATNALGNMLRSINAGGALGIENNLSRAVSGLLRPGSKTSAADFGAQVGGSAFGQFIPAITSDINAVLNQTDLNPTHEAANTKGTKLNPKTGNQIKDPISSAGLSLASRVPFLSQNLPRKEGVAADDLLDRVTRGSRDTATSIKRVQDAKATEQRAAYDTKNDIPNPDNSGFNDAIESRIEKGQFDKAIEGLKQKVAIDSADKNIPQSKIKKLRDKVTQLQITKDNNYEPGIISLYDKTSLTEWRKLGDPKSDSYDPKTYALLYDYDTRLAKGGVSDNSEKSTKNKYKGYETRKGRGRGGSRGGASSSVTGNTLGSAPDLGKISFGSLTPRQINTQIPIVQLLKPSELTKSRKISVTKAR